jgi:peptidoglycan/LPS O-acetylase OafA/YrhL
MATLSTAPPPLSETPLSKAAASHPAGRLETLEVSRGVAALLVVLTHAGYLVAEPRYFGADAFGGVLRHLHIGVDFFFVLSGFIIAHVHWHDIGRRERLARYARRRFVRIYPAYWLVLLAIVPVYQVMPQLGLPHQHDWRYVVTSFLLFPMPEQPILGVAWTLTHEMFFYLLFGLLILLGWRVLWLVVAWVGLIFWVQLAGAPAYPLSFLGNAYNLQFLIGLLVAALLRRGTLPGGGWLAMAGLLVFAVLAIGYNALDDLGNELLARLVFAGAAAAIVAGLVSAERRQAIVPPRLFVALGAASYALYLSHVVVESFAMRPLMRLPAVLRSPEIVALGAALGAVAGGWLYHRHVERVVIRLLNRAFDRGFPKLAAWRAASPPMRR